LRSGPAGVGRAGADRVFHERDGRQRQRLRHGMDLRHLPAAGPPARLHRYVGLGEAGPRRNSMGWYSV
jgi:hypothetical protein